MSFPEAQPPPSPFGPPSPPPIIGAPGVLLRVLVPPFIAVGPCTLLFAVHNNETLNAVAGVWAAVFGLAGVVLACDAAYKLARQIGRRSGDNGSPTLLLAIPLAFAFIVLQALLAGFAIFAGCLCLASSSGRF